jgi:hypothetical protein
MYKVPRYDARALLISRYKSNKRVKSSLPSSLKLMMIDAAAAGERDLDDQAQCDFRRTNMGVVD